MWCCSIIAVFVTPLPAAAGIGASDVPRRSLQLCNSVITRNRSDRAFSFCFFISLPPLSRRNIPIRSVPSGYVSHMRRHDDDHDDGAAMVETFRAPPLAAELANCHFMLLLLVSFPSINFQSNARLHYHTAMTRSLFSIIARECL